MAGENRTVRVKLEFDLSGNATDQMKVLAQSTNAAKEAQDTLKKSISDTYRIAPSSASPYGSRSSILDSLIRTSGNVVKPTVEEPKKPAPQASFMENAFKVYAGAAIASHYLGAASNIMNAATDPYANPNNLGRTAFKELVPFGHSIMGLTDALTGRNAEMLRADVSHRQNLVDADRNGRIFENFAIHEQRYAGAYGAQRIFENQRAITNTAGNFTTALGEREYREAAKLLPLKQQTLAAEREQGRAANERLAIQMELNDLQEKEEGLKTRRTRFEFQASRVTGPEEVRLRGLAEAANSELKTNYSQQQHLRESLTQAQAKEIGANAEVTRARNRQNILGTAEILEDRAAQKQNAQSRLGGMHIFEQNYAIQSLQLLQKYGRQGVSEDILRSAQSIAPETVRKILEKEGGNAPNLKLLQQIAPGDFLSGATAAQDLESARALRNIYAEKDFHLDRESGAQIEQALKTVGQDIARIIVEQSQAIKSEVEAQLRIANAHK